jgi:hypothetical protein
MNDMRIYSADLFICLNHENGLKGTNEMRSSAFGLVDQKSEELHRGDSDYSAVMKCIKPG